MFKIFASSFLALIMFVYNAGALATVYYSYGMQIVDINGDYLPRPRVPISIVEQGIQLLVKNGLDYADRFMIICVLNGYLQSFSTNGIGETKQAYYKIDAKDEVNVELRIKCADVFSDKSNILHITTVGCLDYLPENEYEAINSFSHTISIPLDVGNSREVKTHGSDEHMKQNFEMDIKTLSHMSEVMFIPDHGKIDGSIQLSYFAEAETFELEAAIYAKKGPICTFFFLNNNLLRVQGKDGIILDPDERNIYTFKEKIQLPPGKSQLYAIWLPLDEQPAIFSTTDKIIVETTIL